MSAAPLKSVIAQLYSMAGSGFTDSQLVEQFLSAGDEAAFAALVHRHGPLVLGVGRRVLGAGPDLDDVFQATFVVLARKIRAIRKRASVGSWLYGVAYHLAMKVRIQRNRRRQREHTVGGALDQIVEKQTMHVDPGARADLREVGSIVDEELQRLPAGCRDALILCLMEGLSNSEAAKQLGWPLGTLKTRVQRGRTLLRQQLERRGVSLSAMALSLLVTEQATTAVPVPLLHAAVQSAADNAASAKVAALADTGVQLLGAWKLKLAVSAMLVGLVGLTAAAVSFGSKAAEGSADAPVAAKAQANEVLAEAFDDPLPQGARARLGTARWCHSGAVNFVEFLPDGRTVVSAANDRWVRVWDFAAGKELRRFGPGLEAEPEQIAVAGGYKQDVESLTSDLVAVSRDGKLLATRFRGKIVEVTELATGKQVASLSIDKDDDCGAYAFAPDGRRLAIIGVNGPPIRLWDFVAGKIESEFGKADEKPVYHSGNADKLPLLLYTSDGKTLASVLRPNRGGTTITFWNPALGKELHTVKVPTERYPVRAGSLAIVERAVTSAVFSPDGKLFAYSTNAQQMFTTQAKPGPAAPVPVPESERALYPQVCLLRTGTGELLRKWKLSDRSALNALAFAADSTKLYSKSRVSGGFQEWDVATGTLLRELSPPLANSEWGWRSGCLALSPDGKLLATAGGAHTIRFIDLTTGKDLPAPAGHVRGIDFLSYTADGQSLVTSGPDGMLQLWDTATGKHIKQFSSPDRRHQMTTTAGGRYAAVEDLSGISIKGADGNEVAKIPARGVFMAKGERGEVLLEPSTSFFSPDALTLLVQRRWGTEAELYDVPSGKERCRVTLPSTREPSTRGPGGGSATATIFFAPDGRRFALYSYSETRSLTVHEAATGKALQTILPGQYPGLRGGAFAPDGRTLALDQCDGLIHVIELASGKVRRRFGKKYIPKPGPFATSVYTVSSNPMWTGAAGSSTVAFSPDGRVVAHAGMDNALGIWDTATGRLLARFEGHVGRIVAAAFAPNGRSVATGGSDTTALLWDVSGLGGKTGPTARILDPVDIEARWKDLEGDDAVAGCEAINALVVSPKQAVAFLKTVLQPVNSAVVAKLIEQLDRGDFKWRQEAQAELLVLGDPVVSYLDGESARNISLEARRRLEALHTGLAKELPMTGNRLRLVRAIEALERIGTMEARNLLEALAIGAQGTLQTSQARSALERLRR